MDETAPPGAVTQPPHDDSPLITHHSPLDHLTGWRLDEARAALAAHPATRDCDLRVIETAPPVRAPRAEKTGRQRAVAPVKAGPELRFHDWRVLRCRLVEADRGEGSPVVELVVAREQVSVELLGKTDS